MDHLGVQAIGRPEEAILCYQKAIQIRPDYAIAYGKCGKYQLLFVTLKLSFLFLSRGFA